MLFVKCYSRNSQFCPSSLSTGRQGLSRPCTRKAFVFAFSRTRKYFSPWRDSWRAKSPWYKNIRAHADLVKIRYREQRQRSYRTSIRPFSGRAFCSPVLLSYYLVYLPVSTTESNSKMPFPRENTFRSNPVTVIYGPGWKARSSGGSFRGKKRHADLDSPRENRGNVHRYFVLFRERDVKWR